MPPSIDGGRDAGEFLGSIQSPAPTVAAVVASAAYDAGAQQTVDPALDASIGSSTSPIQEALNPLAVPEGCPTIEVVPLPGQEWAIVAVNLRDPEIIIQNVSNRVQVLTTDFHWCVFPRYERLIPQDNSDAGNLQATSFEPGQIHRVLLVEGDVVEGENVVPMQFDRSGGELALYPAKGTFRDSDRIMAFISWGKGNPTGGREPVAAAAGIWDFSDRIETNPQWAGIVAVGASGLSTGYQSVPLACLP